MTTKKSKEYWEKRAERQEKKVHKEGDKLLKELDKNLINARKGIQKSINDLVARYMDLTELSYVDAIKNLTSLEFKEWRMSLEEYMTEIKKFKGIDDEIANKLKIELETLAMKSRVSRLDTLKAQIDMELNKKAYTEQKELKGTLETVYKDSYKDIRLDFGVESSVAYLDKDTLSNLINYPWSGTDFSNRIWENRAALGRVLKEEIVQSFIQGISVKELSNKIMNRMDSDRKNTERLVRTELNYALNQATKKGYEDSEVEEYEYLAEIDSRTSQQCKELNGKIFKLKDAKVGVNYPPMHPRCRSTTIPVIDYENFGKKKEKLTFEEERAIMKYKSPSMYVLNDKLRKNIELDKEEKEWVKNFDSALKKIPYYKGEVVRTLNIDIKELKNFIWDCVPNKKIFNFKAYTSTSKGEIYDDSMPIRFIIQSSTKGRDISKFGLNEDKILYERNCKFKVLNVEYTQDNKFYIYLEELNE